MKKSPTCAHVSGADRSSFVSRLQLILRHWPSADRLARAMGVSPSAFRKWLKGEAEPSRERLVALAEVAQVSIGWLARGDGPPPQFDAPPHRGNGAANPVNGTRMEAPGFAMFPSRGEREIAGEPDTAATDAQPYIAFRHDWIRSALHLEPDALTLAVAEGTAMAPTITQGNLLLIDTADQSFRRDGIYLVNLANDRLIRRVQRLHDGSLLLIADNAVYQRDVIPTDRVKTVDAIGRVVWVGGTI